ncbi:MAG: S41 family peptidase [Paludibacter sp.]|jgi:carboxyl-terminal processing protease|nr:S41 family peptidase [Paludibacter sp.]
MKKLFLIIFSSIFFTLAAQEISPLQQRKLYDVLDAISKTYVDTIDDRKLVEDAINGMLKSLDPHSSYIPKDEVAKVNEPLQGEFDGIGIQFQMFEDTLLVIQTIAGCPAEKVGVLPGDRIIKVGSEEIAGVKFQSSDIQKRLRGKRGSEVEISVKRQGNPSLLIFKIIRDKIPIYSVDAHYMIDKNIGYIHINNFGANTVHEFEEAANTLLKKGMRKLILSLEGNGGGYLMAARDLADHFLDGNKLVVYTQGSKKSRMNLAANASGLFEKGELIVLVDEYSASASEIVAGALQDWDRAVIVGRRTFGKGLVQGQINLRDGSQMRLTTARYYTPSGRCIQKPYEKGSSDYEKDLEKRYKHGEFFHADSIHFPDSLQYKTLISGRTVYGGGGIMPDVFVPADTTRYTTFFRTIVGRGILNKTIVQFMEKERNNITAKYKNFESYKNNFEVDNSLINRIKELATEEKISFDDNDITTSETLIKRQIKARIASDIWTMNEFYQINDVENAPLQRAVEILQSNNEYAKFLKTE